MDHHTQKASSTVVHTATDFAHSHFAVFFASDISVMVEVRYRFSHISNLQKATRVNLRLTSSSSLFSDQSYHKDIYSALNTVAQYSGCFLHLPSTELKNYVLVNSKLHGHTSM